jgi:hypothetical protein
VGLNPITVTVTAEDGTPQSYTNAVTRLPASSDAELTSLSVSPGTLSPAFSAAQTAYTVGVPTGVDSITVTAALNAGATAVQSPGTTLGTPVSLTAGVPETITVTVTAEDGTTTKSYTITATRAAAADTANPKLAQITINGVPVPGFDPSNAGPYPVSVPYGTSVTVAATAEETGTTITLPSPNPVPLTPGTPETITVTGAAQTGGDIMYTISISQRSQISAAITKANEVISLDKSTANDLSQNAGTSLVITAPPGYDSYSWSVDDRGVLAGYYAIDLRTIEVLAGWHTYGTHTVLLVFEKDGIKYGSEVIFRVVR